VLVISSNGNGSQSLIIKKAIAFNNNTLKTKIKIGKGGGEAIQDITNKQSPKHVCA